MPNERIVPRFPTVLEKGSKVEQSHRVSCNINTIMAKYRKTGLLPIKSQGMYGDYDGPADYLEALQLIQAAKDQFAALPSDIRKRFDNEPANFIGFMSDEANYEEAVQLGLVSRKQVMVTPEPQPITEPEK